MSERDAERNRAYWAEKNKTFYDSDAARSWSCSDMSWGIYEISESSVAALGDVAGLDVIELGCGTAYFSSWLARRGARPVGVDVTADQLATARRCQQQFGLEFPLIEANAEHVPLPAASFDLALSEYGACLWCEPERWVPEAARLLRPGGRLVFLTNSVLISLCFPEQDEAPAETQLQRPQSALRRLAWPTGGVEYHLGHGEWIALLRAHGFEIERLVELYAPPDAPEGARFNMVTRDWARSWPVEELWIARKS
jgi:SAM-dependent methyltransferase